MAVFRFTLTTSTHLWVFVLAVTGLSVLLSVGLTFGIMGEQLNKIGIAVSVSVPLIVAPMASYSTGRLILRINALKVQAEKAAQEAEGANQRLRHTLQNQTLMLSIIGHEVRTPASSLKMMLDFPGYLEKPGRMDTARSTATHLISVLDDMRGLANPDTGQFGHRDKFDLAQLIEDCIHSQSLFAEKQGVKVTFDLRSEIHQLVEINGQLLRQVFINIVRNCLIHSQASALKVTAWGAEGDTVFVRFADNGKGISADRQVKIFEKYGRGDTQAEGLGLGLHLCRDFMRNRLAGDLTLEETQGGGATFLAKFTAPTVKPDRSSEDIDKPLNGKHLLLVEDSSVVRMVSKLHLENAGASVDEAENAKIGMQLALSHTYDLILSDYHMPGISGPEMTRLLKSQNVLAPIVGLTANVTGEQMQEFLTAGAKLVLEKPLNVDLLVKRLAQFEDSTGSEMTPT